MTAQPSTKILNSADFTAALRNLSSGDSVATTSNNKNRKSNSNSNSNRNSSSSSSSSSNPFNSEDFQRFLPEQQSTLAASASNDTTTSTGTPAGATQSLDQLFSTSEFFKSQQFSDLFKSQQSFSQMFQSKDSFADLFKSLDIDQKKALFSSSDAAMKEPLSPSAFPPMEGSVSRTSSTRSLRSSSLMMFQSTDWKNLGSHVDVNYPHSKLFRDNSASTDGTNNDEPMSSIQRHQQLQPQQQQQQQQQQPQQQQQQEIEPAAASKTNWGDVYFAQLQPEASGPSTLPASAASSAPTTTAPVVPPTTKTLPVPLPKKNKKTTTKKTAGQGGKRYIPKPTETDILMGRGGKSNHHAGNKRYREEILNFKNTYAQLRNKEDKTDLSRHVVDYVHKYNGRFLALDKTVKPACWYEITDTVARRKVSQALREDVDPVKRQQKRARFLERKRRKEEEA